MDRPPPAVEQLPRPRRSHGRADREERPVPALTGTQAQCTGQFPGRPDLLRTGQPGVECDAVTPEIGETIHHLGLAGLLPGNCRLPVDPAGIRHRMHKRERIRQPMGKRGNERRAKPFLQVSTHRQERGAPEDIEAGCTETGAPGERHRVYKPQADLESHHPPWGSG
jgi:hypothetical protein